MISDTDMDNAVQVDTDINVVFMNGELKIKFSALCMKLSFELRQKKYSNNMSSLKGYKTHLF